MEDTNGVGAPDGVDSTLYGDVAALLDGTLPEPPSPAILHRSDGCPLFYRGEVNTVFGDPEHGKTWVAQAGAVETLTGGGRVLLLDLDHNGMEATIARLLLLGAPKEALADRGRFRYCEPHAGQDVMEVVAHCHSWAPGTVVVDSTGELVPLFGRSSNSGDEYTEVHNAVLQPLADTGAAVVVVDHLAKNSQSRSFGPGGAMAKRRTVGGVSLRVRRVKPFDPDHGGMARLWVNKDRHGGVRRHCPPPKPQQDEQFAGIFVLAVTESGTRWHIAAPGGDGVSPVFRPTTLMERLSRAMEDERKPQIKSHALDMIVGNKKAKGQAFDILKDEGYLVEADEQTQSGTAYVSAKPYRAKDDPLADEQGLADRLRQHTPDSEGNDAEDD